MANQNNPGGGEDMYGDGGGAPAPAEAAPKEESEDAGQTALVPSSLCPGMKPGQEMVVKIVKVHEDQYEIQYAPEGEHDEKAEAEAPMPQGGGMQTLMED